MDGASVARFNQSGSGFLDRLLVERRGLSRRYIFCSSAPAKGGVDNGSGCPPSSFSQLKSCSEQEQRA